MLLRNALLLPSLSVLASRLHDAHYMIRAKTNRDLREAISAVLESPHITSALSPACLSILHALRNPSSNLSHRLFRHICGHLHCHRQEIGREDPLFWHWFIDNHFCAFAQSDSANAQEIIDQIVIPNHPFSVELSGIVTIDSFLQWQSQNGGQSQGQGQGQGLGLSDYLESTAGKIFKRKFNEIFTKTDPSHDAQCQLYLLLDKYKKSVPYPDSKYRYAHNFLMNVQLQDIRPVFRVLYGPISMRSRVKKMVGTAYRQMFLSNNYKPRPYEKTRARIKKLASAVYCNMQSVSREKAQQAQDTLAMLLPEVYKATADKEYKAVVDAYVKSGLCRRSDPDEVRPFVTEMLQNGRVTAQISPDVLSILKAFEQDSALCRGFFFFVCQYFSAEDVALKKDAGHFWNFFVNRPFIKFVELNKEQALAIVCQVVVPNHPLLSLRTEPGLFSEAAEFFEEVSDLTSFVEQASRKLFTGRLSQILANADGKERQLQIMVLMYNHEYAFSWQLPRYKYAYGLLTELLLEMFEITTAEFEGNYETLFDNPEMFALGVYNKLIQNRREGPRKVVDCLARVISTRHNYSLYKPYQETLKEYTKSESEPEAGLRYFRSLITRALQNPKVSRHLFPPYRLIMCALQSEQPSQAHQTFFCYTFQNYSHFWFGLETSKPYFWCSLIFSSLAEFKRTHADQAEQIVRNTLTPPVGHDGIDQWPVPLESDLFSGFNEITDKPLDYAARCGHAASVELLVATGQDFSEDTRYRALADSVAHGHVEIFEYLLCSRLSFSDIAMNHALISAALHGCTVALELLINSGYDFGIEAADKALENAVRERHVATVLYLLNSGLTFRNNPEQILAMSYSWLERLMM